MYCPTWVDLNLDNSLRKIALTFVIRKGHVQHTGPMPAAQMAEIIGQADIIIGKQRHGPTGTVKVEFEGIYTKFKNASKTG